MLFAQVPLFARSQSARCFDGELSCAYVSLSLEKWYRMSCDIQKRLVGFRPRYPV